MNIPDDRPPFARRRAWPFIFGYGGVILLLTGAAVFNMWQDQSWGALWIAIIVAPITNLAVMAGGLIAAGFYLRRHPAIRKSELLPSVISIPLISAAVIFACLFLLDLHGC